MCENMLNMSLLRSSGLHSPLWGGRSLADQRTTQPTMHSVQEELSGHLYIEVKYKYLEIVPSRYKLNLLFVCRINTQNATCFTPTYNT